MSQGPWQPSREAQATQWWVGLILRSILRLIGIGGLLYELLLDKLQNPTALMVFGGIAGIPDVMGYRAMVKQQADSEKADES